MMMSMHDQNNSKFFPLQNKENDYLTITVAAKTLF